MVSGGTSGKPDKLGKLGKNVWGIARWILVLAFGTSSVVLLVAEKIGAGVAFACSTLVVALPLRRLVKNERLLWWVRVVSVASFLGVAVVGIAGTDLRPEQEKTGIAAVDKVMAIFDGFRDKVLGRENATEHASITEETAAELTECMRSQGLADLPDPQLTEDGISFDFSRMSESPEEIRAAQDACRHVLETAK